MGKEILKVRKCLELKKAMWERRQGRITAILGQLWLRLKDFSSPFFAQCPLLDLLARRHHIGAFDDDGASVMMKLIIMMIILIMRSIIIVHINITIIHSIMWMTKQMERVKMMIVIIITTIMRMTKQMERVSNADII